MILNEYYAPARLRSWPRAQRIHGIPPERVWGLPSLGEKAKEITLALSEAELLVGYNEVLLVISGMMARWGGSRSGFDLQ